MGISRPYLLLFCAVVALLGFAVLAITTGVLVYPITRPIPAWYVYAAGYFLSVTLLIFAPLGVSRSSTCKASRFDSGREYLMCLAFPRQQVADVKGVTGLWCRTGKVVVNNIAKITLWLAIIMFALALLFLLAAVAAWRQKRKGIREQVPPGFGETAPLMIAGTRLTYA
ncbi:hypothetical protein FOZ62_002567 [Perkinsus olseni]|uniref:Uncharacterized protein n=1 Tax=Perkinsus olseni TaxID=32597 RepID=A0A7J6SZR2_PEROL|nr:hypothetical protein FOZ62_002567 [Perkinsus olseni]